MPWKDSRPWTERHWRAVIIGVALGAAILAAVIIARGCYHW
jgi:predicted phosphoribosyltransferase